MMYAGAFLLGLVLAEIAKALAGRSFAAGVLIGFVLGVAVRAADAI